MQSKATKSLEQSDFDIDELVSWLEMMTDQELDLSPPIGEKSRRRRLKSTVYITLQGDIEPKRRAGSSSNEKLFGLNISDEATRQVEMNFEKNFDVSSEKNIGEHFEAGIGGMIEDEVEDNIAHDNQDNGLSESNINVDGFDQTSIWGYGELVRLGSQIEFAAVIIDPNRRGRGHSHYLIEEAIERWRQDAILHGTNPPLSAENRLGLFCFTRHAGLAIGLLRAGFEQRPAVRHWSRLWLCRSSVAPLPFSTQFSLLFNRFFRTVKTLFSDPNRVIHQAKHLSNYQLYTFDDTKVSTK